MGANTPILDILKETWLNAWQNREDEGGKGKNEGELLWVILKANLSFTVKTFTIHLLNNQLASFQLLGLLEAKNVVSHTQVVSSERTF